MSPDSLDDVVFAYCDAALNHYKVAILPEPAEEASSSALLAFRAKKGACAHFFDLEGEPEKLARLAQFLKRVFPGVSEEPSDNEVAQEKGPLPDQNQQPVSEAAGAPTPQPTSEVSLQSPAAADAVSALPEQLAQTPPPEPTLTVVLAETAFDGAQAAAPVVMADPVISRAKVDEPIVRMIDHQVKEVSVLELIGRQLLAWARGPRGQKDGPFQANDEAAPAEQAADSNRQNDSFPGRVAAALLELDLRKLGDQEIQYLLIDRFNQENPGNKAINDAILKLLIYLHVSSTDCNSLRILVSVRGHENLMKLPVIYPNLLTRFILEKGNEITDKLNLQHDEYKKETDQKIQALSNQLATAAEAQEKIQKELTDTRRELTSATARGTQLQEQLRDKDRGQIFFNEVHNLQRILNAHGSDLKRLSATMDERLGSAAGVGTYSLKSVADTVQQLLKTIDHYLKLPSTATDQPGQLIQYLEGRLGKEHAPTLMSSIGDMIGDTKGDGSIVSLLKTHRRAYLAEARHWAEIREILKYNLAPTNGAKPPSGGYVVATVSSNASSAITAHEDVLKKFIGTPGSQRENALPTLSLLKEELNKFAQAEDSFRAEQRRKYKTLLRVTIAFGVTLLIFFLILFIWALRKNSLVAKGALPSARAPASAKPETDKPPSDVDADAGADAGADEASQGSASVGSAGSDRRTGRGGGNRSGPSSGKPAAPRPLDAFVSDPSVPDMEKLLEKLPTRKGPMAPAEASALAAVTMNHLVGSGFEVKPNLCANGKAPRDIADCCRSRACRVCLDEQKISLPDLASKKMLVLWRSELRTKLFDDLFGGIHEVLVPPSIDPEHDSSFYLRRADKPCIRLWRSQRAYLKIACIEIDKQIAALPAERQMQMKTRSAACNVMRRAG